MLPRLPLWEDVLHDMTAQHAVTCTHTTTLSTSVVAQQFTPEPLKSSLSLDEDAATSFDA